MWTHSVSDSTYKVLATKMLVSLLSLFFPFLSLFFLFSFCLSEIWGDCYFYVILIKIAQQMALSMDFFSLGETV